LTSPRSIRQTPNARGSSSHTDPVRASWAQSWPVKPPSYIEFCLNEKSSQGWAFSNQALFVASSIDRVGNTNQ
jgi:hypothetical protein